MQKFILPIFSTIFTLFVYAGLTLAYKRNYDLMVNKTIRISKNLKLIINGYGSDEKIIFINHKEEIDYIKGFLRKTLHCFVFGEKGYYVINRFTGKMKFYQSYDLVPQKYICSFDKIISS